VLRKAYTPGNLRPVLIAAVVAANLFVCGLLAYMLNAARNQQEGEVRTAVENVALLLDLSITEAVGKIDLSLRAIADDLEGELRRKGRLEDLDAAAILGGRRTWLSGFAATFRVTDTSGTVRYCTDCALADQDNFANRDFFSRHHRRDGGGLIVGTLSTDRPSHGPEIWFTRSYTHPDGRFAGVIAAVVPAGSFARQFANLDLGPHGVAVLRDANAAIIARFPPAADPSQRIGSTARSQALTDLIASGVAAGIFHTAQSGDGVERTLAYRRLSAAPFHVVVGMGTDDYLVPLRDLVAKSVAVAALFLLGSTALAWGVWRSARRTERANQRSQSLLRNASDGIHILDAHNDLIETSDAFCRMLGYTRAELIGMNVNEWDVPFAGLARDEVDDRFGVVSAAAATRETRHRRKDGRYVDVEVTARLVDLDGQRTLFCSARDITERKAAEARNRRLSNLYAALSQCNQAIVHCADQAALLPKICRCVVEYGFARIAWIGFVDAAGQRVDPVAAYGDTTRYLDGLTVPMDTADPLSQAPSATSIRENRAIWYQDVQRDLVVGPTTPSWRQRAEEAGIHGLAALPLHRRGLAVGCLVVYADTDDAFDEEARRLLIEMAMDISFALDNFDREADRRRSAAAVQASETRYHLVFQTSPDAIAINRLRDGTYAEVNDGFVAMSGFGRDELIGRTSLDLGIWADPDDRRVLVERLRRTAIHRNMEVQFRRKNGDLFWGLMSASVIELDGEPCLLSLTRDISDIKAAEARARRLSNLYAALSQCNQAIVHCADQAELFAQICRCAVEYGFVKTAWIGLIDTAGPQVKPVAWHGDGDDLDYLEYVALSVDEDDPRGGGPSGRAIRGNQPQWCQDFQGDATLAPWHELGRKAGWMSSASLPLRRNGIPVGCLVIYADVVNAFDEDARRLLTEMAMDISFALDNFDREAERRRSAAALLASETHYRLVFQTSPDAISISRLDDGTYLEVNDGFIGILGFDRDEILGRSSLDLAIWADPADRRQLVENLRQSGLCRNMEARFRKRNGELLWGLLSVSLMDLDGESCLLALIRDISDIKLAEEEIKTLAFYDPLTHLPNRRLLTDRLRQAVALTARNKRKCALLFVDLDNFKTLNDSGGHAVGDLLLREVARRLTACVREADTVARLGGDEFVVLIEDLGDNLEEAAQQAETVGEKILAIIARPYLLAGREYRSTTSIGVTLFGGVSDSADALLTQADIAMYQAKAAGRNTLRFFSPDLQVAINSRASLEEDLRRAIEREQFALYYQPQLEHGEVVGAEALIRWNHPRRGVVAPGEFIPLAEETGLILPLGQWVLEIACRQIAAWGTRDDADPIVLAVNVSALQFRQPDFIEQMLATLERTGADPRYLKLELTESMLVDDIEGIIATMTVLRSRGVRFSLDDFGTGYSSLSYLKRLPLDQLKIDRSFVKDVLTDANDAAIAQTIVALGQTMGLSVIAEGVETEAQRDFLVGLGCHAFQGYLFGRPVPLPDFERFLQDPVG
jgi:diguanylate cyclase (GGDEF)-like protein/PAS domain S-box-containing protein